MSTNHSKHYFSHIIRKGSPRDTLQTAPIVLRTLPVLALSIFLLVGLVSFVFLLGALCPQNTQALEGTDSPLTVTIKVEGFPDTIPALESGKDFTPGQPVKSNPRFMVDEQGNQILANLIEEKEAEGYQLVWKTDDSTAFDWFNTAVSTSITVIGTFEKAEHGYHCRIRGYPRQKWKLYQCCLPDHRWFWSQPLKRCRQSFREFCNIQH